MEIRNHVLELSKEMKRKGYRDQSVKNYVSCVERFLKHFNGIVTEPIKVNEYQNNVIVSCETNTFN